MALAIVENQVKRVEGEVIPGTLGSTMTAGMQVFQDPDDNRFYPGSSNQSSNGPAKVTGVLLGGGVAGADRPIQVDGIIDLGAGAAPVKGTTYVLGADGSWEPISAQVSGWWCVLSGVADENNQMRLILENFGIRKP